MVLMAGIAGIGYYEFINISKNKNNYPDPVTGFAAVFLIVLNAYFKLFEFGHFMMLFVPVLFLRELFRNKNSAMNNTGSALLGIFYTGLLPSSVVMIRELYSGNAVLYDTGAFLIIALLVSIWVCDSAAFFVGSAIGKHKLFPRVSPKKSWEGAIAGFFFSIITMIVMKYLLIDFLSLPDAVMIGVIVGIFGQIGDLAESLIKRDAGVKDSSNLIPGHGGILDRFDSLLYTAPLVYLYMQYIA